MPIINKKYEDIIQLYLSCRKHGVSHVPTYGIIKFTPRMHHQMTTSTACDPHVICHYTLSQLFQLLHLYFNRQV